MNVKLAPCISIHGVLVDVYGVGVLIMGCLLYTSSADLTFQVVCGRALSDGCAWWSCCGGVCCMGSGEDCEAWACAVSYTHLDVYKRQIHYYGQSVY